MTCEFAGLTPNVTRNPHDLDAHARRLVQRFGGGGGRFHGAPPFGTQTGGSVLRPASFCGVVGYKPTYNLICRGGMKFAAESRDTIGLIARTVDDVDLVATVLTGAPAAYARDSAAPKIGLCRTHLWDAALPESKHAVEDAAQRLEARGRVVPRCSPARTVSALSRKRARSSIP